ncbi:hypothetical protein BST61_g3688 [Cercospora zeina]
MDRLSSLLTAHLSQLPHALVPEVFQSSSPSTTAALKRHSDTAWLDGLRGVAALMVVLQHEQAMVYMGHAFCYHWPEQISPASWPILRLAFSGGSFAVVVFFVISGYVVPRRLLRHLQENRQAEFIEALNSAVIRRHGRLLMPSMLSALFILFFYWITGIEPNWSVLGWRCSVLTLPERRIARTIVLHTTLVVALLLASFPKLKYDLPPEVAVAQCSSWPSFLFNITPLQYWAKWRTSGIQDFWYFWAAWLLAMSIRELRWAKKILESNFPQYLGRHSFSLYLTHLVVGSTFSRTILILCGFGYHGGPKAKWPFNKFPVDQIKST